ncbi:Ca-activated chloride channel family protein [Loktanella ponticola]|uniref:Ca-activated chloride channel family protein n=1 Tax=Yoonia ponticola TaxID=1524255 RepID=A0A7W9BLF7_9RHOB|nr:VWA domain-containing protein [Yoonia ponticola]MBB5722625.1 Ca-activated chloride channel family protein [Yoonia ponticola]
MNDDLDDLKAMMTTPKPDAQKRAADLALAQKNFDNIQGSTDQPRPTPATGLNGLWTGVTTMLSTFTSKGGLTATTALVACGFLFLTPTGQDMWLETKVTPTAPDADIVAVPEVDMPADIVDPIDPMPEAAMSNEVQKLAEVTADDDANTRRVLVPIAPETADVEMMMDMPQEAPAPPVVLRRAPIPNAANTANGVALGAIAQNMEIAPAEVNTESFANADSNPLKVTAEEPVSTFSIDVDTASYSIVRNSIMRGQLPPAETVRIEEMINYFPYDYAAPEAGGDPFQPTVSVMPTPWNPDTQLVHIALQGELPIVDERPALNLVFLIDTSGSMSDVSKLPLLKQSFLLMLDQLRPEDEVAIVEYAGSAGQVLAPTPASERTKIRNALNGLGAGGSTNGQGGLEQAYAVAESMSSDGEVSRVLLATDGDFNVGLSDPNGLEKFIADKRDTGTFLSVLGFGRGNLNDQTMQTLAQNGNGTAAYIDTLSEAQKVLVDQLTGALFPIASDVKVQVEFDPTQIAEYRLIGYETRALNREDFNNDAVDAGDLGAGHTVTALYEVTPVGSPARMTDPLRYGAAQAAVERDELGFLKLRYKEPGTDVSQLIETPILRDSTASTEAQFAASIAGFGQILRGDSYLGSWSMGDAIALATESKGADSFGYRAEAIQLMRLAESLGRN